MEEKGEKDENGRKRWKWKKIEEKGEKDENRRK